MKFMNLVFFSLIASFGAVAFMGSSMHEAKNINNMVVRQDTLAQKMRIDEGVEKKHLVKTKHQKNYVSGILKLALAAIIAPAVFYAGVFLLTVCFIPAILSSFEMFVLVGFAGCTLFTANTLMSSVQYDLYGGDEYFEVDYIVEGA